MQQPVPNLSDTLRENEKAINPIHIMGTIMLIYLTVASWYFSSKYSQQNGKPHNIEPKLRYIQLFNMCLMCIVFPGLSMSKQISIGRYYTTHNLKKWYQVDYNDYPSHYLYLFMFCIQLFCLHQTINVIKIFYDTQKSLYCLRHYGFIILFAHSMFYFIVAIITKCNPFILMIFIVFSDYTQHLILCGIYFRRLFHHNNWFNRNLFGFIGVMAHMISILPVLIERSILDSSIQSTETQRFSFVFMYLFGFINLFGWYKVIILTPKEFIINEKKIEINTDQVMVSISRHATAIMLNNEDTTDFD